MNETEYEVVGIEKMDDIRASDSKIWNAATPTTQESSSDPGTSSDYFSTVAFESLKSVREEPLKKIKNLKENIRKLDSQIMELMWNRSALIDSIEHTVGKMSNPITFFGISVHKVINEWRTFHFKSEGVKQMARGIRSIFFDDSNEKVRNFSLVDVREYWNGIGLSLDFTNGPVTFRLNVPQSVNWSIDRNMMFKDVEYCGEFSITYRKHRCVDCCILSSADIEKVRSTITAIAEDFEGTLNKCSDEPSKVWDGYYPSLNVRFRNDREHNYI